jgi:hypothetical protein
MTGLRRRPLMRRQAATGSEDGALYVVPIVKEARESLLLWSKGPPASFLTGEAHCESPDPSPHRRWRLSTRHAIRTWELMRIKQRRTHGINMPALGDTVRPLAASTSSQRSLLMSPLKVWSLEPRRPLAKVVLTLAACTALVGTSASWAQQRPAPDPKYIQFLEHQSMLFQADQQADRISGMGISGERTSACRNRCSCCRPLPCGCSTTRAR